MSEIEFIILFLLFIGIIIFGLLAWGDGPDPL